MFLLLLLAATSALFPQPYRNPVTIPPALSGNFGELRSNHFHSGIDFKTQQSVNKPIVAIEDGYLSRISVSPGGYGLALYVDHPATGHTSVYGHLNSFSDKIAQYVKEKQYELERYQVNLYPTEGELPVRRGEQIALSGNTGSSGGPHLHFEIRDRQKQDPLDVLEYIAPIPDTQKPDLRGIAFYPMEGRAVVNGSSTPLRITLGKDKAGKPLPPGSRITAWGRIGIGLKAYDRMDGQSNIYGVKHIRLFLDDEPIFSSTIRRFSFDETRMLNSFIDFADWRERRSLYMKSFLEPGNRLPFYQTKNRGYVEINEEKEYRFRYELEDHYGNRLTYPFTVKGLPAEIPQPVPCDHFMSWQFENSYMNPDMALTILSGNLYHDICFTHAVTKSSSHYSDIHRIHNTPVPLHRGATLRIRLKSDTLQQKNKYGIVILDRNGKEGWLGGDYSHGGITTTIRELGGRYAVAADSIAPLITPLQPENWKSRRIIRIRLTDDKSGIASFRGEINGRFVLFTHDSKSTMYTYRFDDTRLPVGEALELTFTATDRAGNRSEYKATL
ncbi:MAG: M23 family metallopeptidase [bacterium]|nr:M23 family metallopeptidase [bacterium]MDD3624571.1 M23 family metallopeptidase [Proteiniphilum sp.]